jgi:peptidoglycan L-alanyl-D-glutamate endopeptidase CwlK
VSRKIEDLIHTLRAKYAIFEFRMQDAEIDFIVTCTRRTQAEQDALWEQGRSKPGLVVTWTKRSKHIEGKAFDICIMENGKPDWKVSNPKWTRAGKIGTDIGLDWAGNWIQHTEYPHFQLKED